MKSSTAALGGEKQTGLQIQSTHGKGARAQLRTGSVLSATGGVTFRPSPGSWSLIKPSVCVTHSKCMTPKLLMPSRSWIIWCGPRMPTVGHVCASLLHLVDGYGIAPHAVSQADDKDNIMSAMDRHAVGLWGEKHTWLGWGLHHLDAFPFPVSKPGETPVAVSRQLPVRDNQKWALVEELQHP